MFSIVVEYTYLFMSPKMGCNIHPQMNMILVLLYWLSEECILRDERCWISSWDVCWVLSFLWDVLSKKVVSLSEVSLLLFWTLFKQSFFVTYCTLFISLSVWILRLWLILIPSSLVVNPCEKEIHLIISNVHFVVYFRSL